LKIIVYTPESRVEREIELIAGMLSAGADYLYLRRQGEDDAYWMAYAEQLPFADQGKIFTSSFRVLHEMGLGGFHFTGKAIAGLDKQDLVENLKMLEQSGKKSSATVRSLEELQQLDGHLDILLFSPVFESISKPGYRQDRNLEALKDYLQKRTSKTAVFAQGGINFDRIEEVKSLGFDGITLLGALWVRSGQVMSDFEKIVAKCR